MTHALFEAAMKVRENSYSPYSGYKVACALRTEDGQIFSGINVENASYGATNCAERTAIFTAVASGHRKITEFLILTDETSPWAPCGVCRQVMLEFSEPKTKVILANLKGPQKELTMEELLPHSFSKKDMK